jgi:hypothetical protein
MTHEPSWDEIDRTYEPHLIEPYADMDAKDDSDDITEIDQPVPPAKVSEAAVTAEETKGRKAVASTGGRAGKANGRDGCERYHSGSMYRMMQAI